MKFYEYDTTEIRLSESHGTTDELLYTEERRCAECGEWCEIHKLILDEDTQDKVCHKCHEEMNENDLELNNEE